MKLYSETHCFVWIKVHKNEFPAFFSILIQLISVYFFVCYSFLIHFSHILISNHYELFQKYLEKKPHSRWQLEATINWYTKAMITIITNVRWQTISQTGDAVNIDGHNAKGRLKRAKSMANTWLKYTMHIIISQIWIYFVHMKRTS